MPDTRKKSCLGCDAVEFALSPWGTGFCKLGYKTEHIETIAGHYGKARQLISCNCKPIEECPKPKTVRKYIELRREKEADVDLARERMGTTKVSES